MMGMEFLFNGLACTLAAILVVLGFLLVILACRERREAPEVIPSAVAAAVCLSLATRPGEWEADERQPGGRLRHRLTGLVLGCDGRIRVLSPPGCAFAPEDEAAVHAAVCQYLAARQSI
jgi:hypothetical protein